LTSYFSYEGKVDHATVDCIVPFTGAMPTADLHRNAKVVAEDLPLRRGELLTIALPTIGIADTAPQNCGGTWGQ